MFGINVMGKSISPNGQMENTERSNGFTQTVEPIPDTIPNTVPDTSNISQELLQKQQKKEEHIHKRKEHLTNAFDYWNSITHIKKGKGLPKCTKITKDIEEARNKVYDRYPKDDVAKAFERYIAEIE